MYDDESTGEPGFWNFPGSPFNLGSNMSKRYNSITEAVVRTHRKSGKPVVSITDYWKSRIKPLDYKFAHFIPDIYGNKGRCPFHEDSTPSFGVVRGADGVERFNCFGCQSFGHVVDLHRLINAKYTKKYMSPDEAAISLLNYYSIPVDNFRDMVNSKEDFDKGKAKTKQHALSQEIHDALKSFTVKDLDRAITQGTAQQKPASYYNNLLYKALNEFPK